MVTHVRPSASNDAGCAAFAPSGYASQRLTCGEPVPVVETDLSSAAVDLNLRLPVSGLRELAEDRLALNSNVRAGSQRTENGVPPGR